MKRFRVILVAALVAVIAGTLLAYWLNPPARVPVSDEPGLTELDSDGKPRVKGLTYTHVQDGMRKWSLAARGAKYDEETSVVTLFKPEMVFFQEKGGEITIRGKEGRYEQKTQIVHLEGEVLGRMKDGKYLETDQITYSEIDQVADTNAWVTVAGPGFRVRAKGMLVVVPQSKVTFKTQVDSTFIPQGTGPPPGVTMDAPATAPEGGKP